jgi:cysteine desulfurase
MTGLLLSRQRDHFPALEIFGPDDPSHRLPNTVNVGLPGIAAHRLVAVVEGVALSAGAACHAATPQPSAVLMAMGVPAEKALTALRLCTGRGSTTGAMEQAAAAMAAAASRPEVSL